VDQGGDKRPDEMVTVRLDCPNKLAGIQTGGFYEPGSLSLLFGAKCEAGGYVSSVGHRSIQRSVVATGAVAEAFPAFGILLLPNKEILSS
jgi:hypothetical protein